MNDIENTQPPSPRSAGRTIARNTVFGLGSQLILRGVSFLFQVLVVNQLGGDQFGKYSIVIAWATLFGILGDPGVSQYFTREISRNHKEASSWFWDVVVLRILLAVLASSVTVFGAIIHPYETEIVIGIGIFTFSYVLQAFLVPLQAIISGNERLDVTSIFDVIGNVIFIIAGSLFLFAGFDFIWLVIAGILNIPLLTIMSYRVVVRNNLGPPRFRINPRMWWGLIVRGLPFGLIQLSLSFAYRVDTIILSGYVSDQQVGWYNVSYNLILTLLTVTRAFNNAISPTLTREHAINPEAIRRWYYGSVKALLALGIPIAVGGMLTAGKVIQFLYPAEIYPAAIALIILIWDIPFVMYQSFSGTLSKSIQKEGRSARNYFVLAVSNFVLNLILIPKLGIIGSSFATVLTDIIGSSLFYILLRRELGAGLGLKRLIRIPICAAIMGIVIFLIGDYVHLFLLIVIGAIVYFTLVWVSGAFSSEERQQITGRAVRLLDRLHLARR